MAGLFGVRVADTAESRLFFLGVLRRVNGPGVWGGLATWYVRLLKTDAQQLYYAIFVYSGFPSAWKVAAALTMLPLLFTGLVLSWWLVPGAVLWALSFLSGSGMRFLVLRMGLRRHGYKGRIRRVPEAEVLRAIMEGGS